jgi:pilus assembly protein Flp/PilA
MQNLFARFVSDESGATAIEYGLIAAIVGVGIIASLGTLKTALVTTFGKASTEMTTASN